MAVLRVHRSYVAQMDRVHEVLRDGSSYVLRLEGGARLPMSRRRGAVLQGRLGADRRPRR